MYNGILNVRKEPGFTSHDVVAKLRGIAGQKKIGHTGTLDPDAEGVLPVCLGRATKVVELLADETKTYEAVCLLGRTTDTQDASGTTLREAAVRVDARAVAEALASFLGRQQQLPPMYSAIKVGGKKLYELARQGREIERAPRPVCFYELELLAFDSPRAHLRVTCSKGTYIRTLCHDLGEKLGCGACMEHLVRTRVGRFGLDDAHSLDALQRAADEGRLGELILPVDALFEELPAVHLGPAQDGPARNGNRVAAADAGERARLYDSEGAFVGIFRRDGDAYRPEKMFWESGK